MPRKLRVAIECRIPDPKQGIGTAVLALAKALSDSDIDDQEYTFIVGEKMKDWLAPSVYGPCKFEVIPDSMIAKAKAALREIAPLRFIWKKLRGEKLHMPVSDGWVEKHDFDIVHFPTQMGYLTNLPTIYQPHDLQHLHYPHFFSKDQFARREGQYRILCNRASFVCVHAEWTKRDVLEKYGLPEERVVVIPWGSVFDAYSTPSAEEIQHTVERFGLPSVFFFYPAATWPHKNHEIILRALHFLKSNHGIAPEVFFTGASSSNRPALDKLAQDLGVSEQLHFLGFVSPAELQSVFRVATAMIYPSRFEGFGLPILEAFQAQLPVLSSNATVLPEIAQEGALYFDPDSPAELSKLMMTILERPELRRDLADKGNLVLAQFSFKKTAASFQSLYAKTAAISSQDRRRSPASEAD